VFAALIAQLIHGETIREALRWAKTELPQHKGHSETPHALEAAEHVARSTNLAAHNAIEKLGGGWVAEEALAIAIYRVLKAESLEEGLVMAVNHGGDSDSCGSMVGHLLGCLYGVQQIPSRWLEPLELRDVITQIADGLLCATNPSLEPSLMQRYGGGL
jgi:ADP-ribosylglycohydrolase